MSDLISRQAALNTVQNMYDRCDTGSMQDYHDLLMEAFEILPSADAVEVRHGHWMLSENQNQDDVNNGNYLYVCSNCNHSDIHARTADVPYCWHCGARMDGET